MVGVVIREIKEARSLSSLVGGPLVVWFLSDFRDKHRGVVGLLHAVTSWPLSDWKLALDAETADIALTTKSGAREARRVHGEADLKTGNDLLRTIAKVDLEVTGGPS